MGDSKQEGREKSNWEMPSNVTTDIPQTLEEAGAPPFWAGTSERRRFYFHSEPIRTVLGSRCNLVGAENSAREPKSDRVHPPARKPRTGGGTVGPLHVTYAASGLTPSLYAGLLRSTMSGYQTLTFKRPTTGAEEKPKTPAAPRHGGILQDQLRR